MSKRVITSITYDLRYIVAPGFPPACTVLFTDVAADGHEEPGGRVTFTDADAQIMWTAADKIAAANKLLDAKAAQLPDLPTIAARMTAVDDLDRQIREKQAALAAMDAQMKAKQAEAEAAAAVPVVTP